MSQKEIRHYVGQQAREWVRILRQKWGVRGFRVGAGGIIKYEDIIFAVARFHPAGRVFWWEILVYDTPEFRTTTQPTILYARREYLVVAEQVPPQPAEKLSSKFFLTLALVHHFLQRKFSRRLQETAIRIIHPQCIEFTLPEWKGVGASDVTCTCYLRFPLIDETTDPKNYLTYFVTDEITSTQSHPIPYKHLIGLKADDFIRLGALTML
jgi:hypothetical protein